MHPIDQSPDPIQTPPSAAGSGAHPGQDTRLVEGFPFPVMVVDAGGYVRAANEPARRLFDATLLGAHVTAVLRDLSFRETLRRALDDCVSSSTDFDLQRSTNLHFRATAQPVEIEGLGRCACVCLVNRTAEQRQASLHRDFVANASHELRTPLATLTACIETLRGPAHADREATDRFLEILQREAARMRAVVDDLLSLNQIEQYEHVRPADRVDLAQVAREAMARRPPESQVDVGGEVEAKVDGDRTELLHALANLLDNADRHAGGARMVRVRAEEERAGVEIEDEGPGVAREHLPRLTERFYRVEPASGAVQQGTGLGLAIVKHVAAHHGGSLDIDSKPGRGSRFTLWVARRAG